MEIILRHKTKCSLESEVLLCYKVAFENFEAVFFKVVSFIKTQLDTPYTLQVSL